MLRIASAEEIGTLLLELPALFRLEEQRSADFPERAREWLGSLEQALSANRLYQAGTGRRPAERHHGRRTGTAPSRAPVSGPGNAA